MYNNIEVYLNGINKIAGEQYHILYKEVYGIASSVLRLTNTYGPRMHPNDGRVVSNFIIQALKNEDITIYGDGKQTRSFCFVDDLISAMLQIMKTEDDFTGPINIGNPEEHTIQEIAEKIIDLTNSNSQIIFKQLPEDDPKQRKPDISIAKGKINWEPKINLVNGLKQTINYFEKIL